VVPRWAVKNRAAGSVCVDASANSRGSGMGFLGSEAGVLVEEPWSIISRSSKVSPSSVSWITFRSSSACNCSSFAVSRLAKLRGWYVGCSLCCRMDPLVKGPGWMNCRSTERKTVLNTLGRKAGVGGLVIAVGVSKSIYWSFSRRNSSRCANSPFGAGRCRSYSLFRKATRFASSLGGASVDVRSMVRSFSALTKSDGGGGKQGSRYGGRLEGTLVIMLRFASSKPKGRV
jgi:hypothetical protein